MPIKIQTYIFISCLFLSCKTENTSTIKETKPEVKTEQVKEHKPEFVYDSSYISKSFDFPVGKPDAKGYYNAQKFQEDLHLGEDWNAVTGGNSDLGDPIYTIANGYVKFADDYGGGWGNIIRIIHKMPNGKLIESLYAHCDTILVQEKQWITKGTKIGTIGNANGQYLAHLHFEIRNNVEMPIGGGYSDITEGYLNPTEFIKQNR